MLRVAAAASSGMMKVGAAAVCCPCDGRRGSVKEHPMTTRKRRTPLSTICNNVVIVKRQRVLGCSYKHHHVQPLPLPDWSSIHSDVLENILKYLDFVDILRCRAVCSAWRSCTRSYISCSLDSSFSISSSSLQQQQQQQPPLILWYKHGEYWFLDITRPVKNLYQINQKSEEVLRRKMGDCVGYSQGWFLFLDKRTSNRLCLFHPLLFSSAAAVCLPRIKTPNGESCKDVFRVVLLSDPILTTTYGVVVIHKSYRHLLFAKCGDSKFSQLKYHDDDDDDPTTRWLDIKRFGNRLYGIARSDNVQQGCKMVAWDCTDATNPPRQIMDFRVNFPHPGYDGSSSSLKSVLRFVESQGELLLVSQQWPDVSEIPYLIKKGKARGNMHKLYSFVRRPDMCQVYKMDFNRKEWVPMDSLGDHRALLVMEFQTMSISTHEFPQYKSNSIYFKHTIAHPGCTSVVAVFNLQDGSMDEIKVHY